MTDAKVTALPEPHLSSILDLIQETKARFQISAVPPHLEACRALLHQKDLIDVGIFRRFKAGKSSLLNHLADRPILPVGVTPVTAVVTRIRDPERSN